MSFSKYLHKPETGGRMKLAKNMFFESFLYFLARIFTASSEFPTNLIKNLFNFFLKYFIPRLEKIIF